jgi:hypothetical protein
MRTIHTIAAVTLLLTVSTVPCFALRAISVLTKDEAREMGITLRVQGTGPTDVWVELEFKPENKLKNYHHVELEIGEANKSLLSYAPLRDTRSSAGVVTVRFLSHRDFVDKLSLSVVCGEFDAVGYTLRVKEFVEPLKAK